jgi:hypothetical protein
MADAASQATTLWGAVSATLRVANMFAERPREPILIALILGDCTGVSPILIA